MAGVRLWPGDARNHAGSAMRAALLSLAPAAGVLAVAGGVSPALAAAPAPSCPGGTCSLTFATTGTGQSFTVPARVGSLKVTLYGGAGGTNSDGSVPGGDGALVTATLKVSPGQKLGVDVGGAGQGRLASAAGGVNGGGSSFGGGGGGGASDVTAAGTDLLVAGGGAGAGQSQDNPAVCGGAGGVASGGTGGNADGAGAAGQAYPAGGGVSLAGGGGGQAGTTSVPGNGGAGGTVTGTGSCPASSGQAGGAGARGTGGSDTNLAGGGGGGGGYFGGGAGGGGALESASDGFVLAGSGGGGGGASYTAGTGVSGASVTDTGNTGQVNGGNGEVVFSWTPDARLHITRITASAGSQRHATVRVTFTDADPAGNLSQYSGRVTWGDGSASAIPRSGFSKVPAGGFAARGAHQYAASGSYTVTVRIRDVGGASATASAQLTVP